MARRKERETLEASTGSGGGSGEGDKHILRGRYMCGVFMTS